MKIIYENEVQIIMIKARMYKVIYEIILILFVLDEFNINLNYGGVDFGQYQPWVKIKN